MIAKALKYDMKAIGKNLLPLYLITVLLCAFTRLTVALEEYASIFGIVGVMTNMFAFISIIVLIVLTFFVCIRRYYVNMFKEQGYLTNVLPVKLGTHVLSKFIASFIYCALSLAVAVGSLAIMYYSLELTAGVAQLVEMAKMLGAPLFFMLLMGLYMYQASVYAAYAIGQRSEKNKITASVTSYLILYFIYQILNLSVFGLFMLARPGYMAELMGENVSAIKELIYLALAVTAFYSVAYYFITVKFLGKKMDIE